MIFPQSWTTVTTLSKTIALILFILLPFGGFYLGMTYQKGIAPQVSAPPISPVPTTTTGIYCAQDVQTCPDGSFVNRQPPLCNFAPCPTTPTAQTPLKVFCGGIANIQCPMTMKCVLEGKYPDAGGTCQ